MDIHGNTRLITKDEEKANALGNFFSSVFTDEMNTQDPHMPIAVTAPFVTLTFNLSRSAKVKPMGATS